MIKVDYDYNNSCYKCVLDCGHIVRLDEMPSVDVYCWVCDPLHMKGFTDKKPVIRRSTPRQKETLL